MFFLLPFLVVGVALLASRHSAPTAPQAPALTSGACAPDPLSVLEGFARSRQTPPPMVILCALAQAEAMGATDLAHSIVATYIEPVVRAYETTNPIVMPPGFVPPPPSSTFASPQQPAAFPASSPSASPAVASSFQNAAPSREQEDASVKEWLDAMARGEDPHAQPSQDPEPTVAVSGAVAIDSAPPAYAPPPHVHSLAVIAPSPLPGVSDERWSTFATRIRREDPSFVGPRHVGMFRQSKARLAEIGLDPARLLGDREAQIHALGVDIADAFGHAHASGMLDEWVGRGIAIPGMNGNAVAMITASGVLGVIQAAGLEGAADWFEKPSDHERYPHTTRAFLQTTGVF